MGRIASAWLLALAIAPVLRAQIPPPPALFDEQKQALQPEETPKRYESLPPKKFVPPPPVLIEPPPVVDIPKPPPLFGPKNDTPPNIDPPGARPSPKPSTKSPADIPPPPAIFAEPAPPPTPLKEVPFFAPPPKQLPPVPPVDAPQRSAPPPSASESKASSTPAPIYDADSPPLNFAPSSIFEDYRLWVGGDFDLWWFQKSPLRAPLVATTTSPAIPGSAANILGVDPNARVIVGPPQINQNPSSGARVWLGTWLDDRRSLGFEVTGMWVESSTTVGSVQSSAAGVPIYSRPVMIVGDGSSVYDISFPGFLAGRFDVESHQFLRGAEANFVGFLVGRETLFFDIIAGARFLNFEDQLDMRQQSTNLVAMPAFGNSVLAPGTVVTAVDSYHANNNFYGGQIGGRLEKTFGRLSVTMIGKVALGVNDMAVTVGGATTRSDTMATYTGGILANSANMGRLTESHFAVVPEGNLAIGWWFTPNIRAKIGYNVLYISDVVRAGSHVRNAVNPGAVPVDAMYGLVPVTRMPVSLQRTDFWAEGITFGIDFRY